MDKRGTGETRQTDTEHYTMNGALHPKSDGHRLYVARQRGGRGLQSVLETVRSQEDGTLKTAKNSY